MRRYVSSVLLVSVVAASILSLGQVEASTITEWTVPTVGSGPWGVFVSGDGSVYFTEANGNKIGRLTIQPAYTLLRPSTAPQVATTASSVSTASSPYLSTVTTTSVTGGTASSSVSTISSETSFSDTLTVGQILCEYAATVTTTVTVRVPGVGGVIQPINKIAILGTYVDLCEPTVLFEQA